MNDPDWTYADELEDLMQQMEDWTEQSDSQGEAVGDCASALSQGLGTCGSTGVKP
jgi:hypothetical protein